jgi:hypothetical protein
MPEAVKALLLVGITLAKIVVIAMFFMHLKGERRDLWILTFSPLILALIMFGFTFGETGHSATHKLIVRPARKAAVAGQTPAPAEQAPAH